MQAIDRKIGSIREDRRADYLFDTKAAAEAVGCHPNKFHDWWYRTRGKLVDLFTDQPAATAAEFMGVIAQAQAQVERRRLRLDEPLSQPSTSKRP